MVVAAAPFDLKHMAVLVVEVVVTVAVGAAVGTV